MFIGRKNELATLEQLYDSNQFQFAVIYGRRRIGKTALINEFLKDKTAIYFTGLEEKAADSLNRFSAAIYDYIDPNNTAKSSFSTFDEAFKKIAELAKKQRVILAIDEYPYLAKSYPTISSLIQYYIDHFFAKTNLFLILCGSSMSFMENQVLAYKSPLYGRRTAQFKLLPFSLNEAQAMLPHASKKDVFIMNSICGGIPQYLSYMDDQKNVFENIDHTFLQRNTPLFEEPNNLLKQELRDPSAYNSIINAIAMGASKQNKIAINSHITVTTINSYLTNLIELGIISKIVPVTEANNPRTKHTLYEISDGMFRFWYTFVGPNISLIERGAGKAVLAQIEDQLPKYLGKEFEKLAQDYMWAKVLDKDLIPVPFQHLGYWWGTDPKTKRKEELDVVGLAADKINAYFGECKWRNEPVSSSVLETLINRSNLINYSKKHYYLFSKVGFTDSCKKLAKKVNCKLITFDEM
ncbi:MAG: ATP-binding protein [Lactobacillus crispatus]|jgi:AAA+ ATPase superfamily predicted ATPase|uniref:ATP-binding protein n=1 Tax=Lactobacillus crispatus TaxID=47770 RepID=UPI0018ABE76A|nr:ATP-binding protein [Lactobacillus crispatus]MCH4005509.1 ATP-binding protein [Lactobacillus crispatus]MCI1336258.1 ATP-binding protein [Lactobacillus crispatus]MCI1365534.1 ATP-binding protein [Lactobacillus crispatus]MCI1494083.1 ATP-binding protein [Lactobacillus crispatus]MCI1538434.1 ATP-binding protein [Lactobacillus crispatus]